jgi:hypothetical protein
VDPGAAHHMAPQPDALRLALEDGVRLRARRRVFDTLSTGKLQSHVGDDTFGVKVLNFQTNLGELKIVPHRLLDDAGSVYSGYAIAVDFASQAISTSYLNGDGPGGGRDTHVKTNIQETDRDGQKDQILTECGLQVGLPETGGVATGITG